MQKKFIINGSTVTVSVLEDKIYLNTTPHEISMVDKNGKEFTIPKSGILLNATPNEILIKQENRIDYVSTNFTPSKNGMDLIENIKNDPYLKDSLIIGSIIAAQAYPGDVLGLVSADGFERMPPNEKKMRLDKFIIF